MVAILVMLVMLVMNHDARYANAGDVGDDGDDGDAGGDAADAADAGHPAKQSSEEWRSICSWRAAHYYALPIVGFHKEVEDWAVRVGISRSLLSL